MIVNHPRDPVHASKRGIPRRTGGGGSRTPSYSRNDAFAWSYGGTPSRAIDLDSAVRPEYEIERLPLWRTSGLRGGSPDARRVPKPYSIGRRHIDTNVGGGWCPPLASESPATTSDPLASACPARASASRNGDLIIRAREGRVRVMLCSGRARQPARHDIRSCGIRSGSRRWIGF